MNSAAPTMHGPNKAAVSQNSAAVNAAAVTKRLQQELTSMMCGGAPAGISAFPKGDSLFEWVGTMTVSR